MSNVNEELKAIAQKHTVRYEVWPHWEIHEDARIMVGFNLELLGTYDHGHSPLAPGSEGSDQTYEDLKRIALEILPKEVRPSYYEIEPFDHALHTEGRGPNEIVLVIRIQHRSEFFSPIDACENRCLAEMEGNLKALGISGRRRH